MPQIYASFTNTPLFVIAYSENNSLVGYFLKPSYIFKQPTLSEASSAVVHFQHHFEPVIIPNRLVRAWEAIYESYDTQDLQMAAIRVQLTQEDLRGDVGQRQQGQGGGNRLPGDYIGIITIDIFWSRRTQSFEPNSLLAFEYFVVLPPSVIVFLVFEFHFFQVTVATTKAVLECRTFKRGALPFVVKPTGMARCNRDKMTGDVCQVMRLNYSLQYMSIEKCFYHPKML